MARILILAPDLSSGALYTAHQFAGALARRHSVHLTGPGARGLWPPLREEARVDLALPGSNPFSRRVRRSLCEHVARADWIYAFKAMPPSYGLALWARRHLGVRVALHLDDWDGGWFEGLPVLRRAWQGLRTLQRPNSWFYVRPLEGMAGCADALTVSTTALRRRFGGTVVRQGVDTAAVCPAAFPRAQARRRLGIEHGQRLVLFLGTPQPHKGVEDLARAFARLCDPRARLWLVSFPPAGGGTSREWPAVPGLERREGVSFSEACWHMAAADAFVIPQRPTPYAEHQLPAKLLQAMALGAPIVATSVGDVAEILGGEPAAGVVVPPLDPDGLARALGVVLRDPDRARALGAEARRRSEREYGWEAMGRQLEAALPFLELPSTALA